MIIFAIVLIVVWIRSFKIQKSIIKTTKRKARAKVKCGLFFSKKTNVFYKRELYTFVKTYSLYQIQEVDFVLQKIRLNCPIIYKRNINYELLSKVFDINLPFYVEENFNKTKLKTLLIAKKIENFNLVVFNSDNKLNCCYDRLTATGIYAFKKQELGFELVTNIYMANINKKIKYNSKMNLENNLIDIKLNNQIINFKTKLYKYNIINYYENKNIAIIFECFKYKGFNIKFNILNKSNLIQNINISVFKSLIKNKLNYYKFKRYVNYLSCFDMLHNKYVYYKFDTKFNIKTSLICNTNISNLPIVNLSKNIKLKANEKCTFEIIETIALGLDFTKNLFFHNVFYEKLFAFKVNSDNKKLDELFNNTLPNEIIFNQFQKVNYYYTLTSFVQALTLYKLKKVTAFELYDFLLREYFGVKLRDNFIAVSPLCDYDFVICYNNKTRINVTHGKNKFVIIDGVKYHNYQGISLSQLNEISSISLVI